MVVVTGSLIVASSSGVTVKVFYATDRKRLSSPQRVSYGADEDPADALSYGTLLVSLPPGHQRGQIEEPSIFRLEFHEDPKKHVVIQSVAPESKDSFFSDVDSAVRTVPKHEALVFIHGYNVSFDDAAKRAAQLAYDLGVRGVPVLYSWPSRGTLRGYTADEESVVWTAPHLMQFLKDLHDRTGATTVHVIAHSMGNRAFLNAMEMLAREKSTVHLGQVVLAAPDVACSHFVQQIPIVQTMADHITLYASSGDEALAASQRVNHYPRAGQSAGALTIIPPVETIDASSIKHGFLGHSYFGDNTLVLEDMTFLIGQGMPAAQRALRDHAHLKQSGLGASMYWTFVGP